MILFLVESRQLLFFTGATKFFHNFLPLYFLFGSLEHPGASFEFLVDDMPRILALHRECLDRISSLTGSSYYLHDVKTYSGRSKPLMQNSYRFLLQPFLQAEFVYIGDIDIIITENVIRKHMKYFSSGLPYYNFIRPGAKRLSGLHLARYEHFYPLAEDVWDYADLNDEEILYKSYETRNALCEEALVPLFQEIGRPNCGIHVSTNRLPFSMSRERAGWGIYARALKKIDHYFEDPEVRSVIGFMYQGSRTILMNLIVIARGLNGLSEDDRSLFLLKDNVLRLPT